MGSNRKKLYRTVIEAFQAFIPDYVPRDLRKRTEESKEEEKLATGFTSCLVDRFKEDISAARPARR